MYLLITAVLIAGAFAIARTATAHPDNSWLANVTAPRQPGPKVVGKIGLVAGLG